VALQAGEASDPIAEADVYMAYGRYTQAEELLKGSIAEQPDRNELRIKLLEVYHGAKNADAFEREAEALRSRLSGTSDPLWDNVVSMGMEVCPDSPLFSEHLTPEVDAHSMTMVLTEEELSSAAEDFGQFGETAAMEAPAAGPHETVLDFGEAAEEALTATPPKVPEPAPAEVDEGMEFDLGFLDEATGEEQGDDQGMDLDFELEEEETPPEAKTQALDAAAEAKDEGLDFSLDFNTEDTGGTGAAEEAELDLGLDMEQPADASADQDADLDLSLEDFGLAETEDSSATDDTGMMEGLDFLSEDTDEVSTKLDLAKAYIDMGDEESARGILEEVVSDGSDSQKAEAREIIGRITH
jgi:pilus assembly protein FimV